MRLCSLYSGSSGNAIYVGSDHTHILVDVGVSAKKILEALSNLEIKPEEIDGILITHEHSDHIAGLGVMLRKYGIPVYGTPKTLEAVLQYKSLGKVDVSLFHGLKPEQSFQIKDMWVKPISTWHDAADPVCYTLMQDEKKVSIATILKIEQFFSVSRKALLNRMLKLKFISQEQYDSFNGLPVKWSASAYGYDLSLYETGNENLIIGDFGEKARLLFENEKISEGHYHELMQLIGYGEN